MDFFEDFGGCTTIAIIGVILLVIIVCVAIVVLGGSLPNLIG
jgi:Sec-independent protein translocase protein TatA